MIVRLGDVEITLGVHDNADGVVKLRLRGRSAVAGLAEDPIAGHGGNDAGGVVHLAEAVVLAVCEEDVAGGVHCHRHWVVYRRGGGRSAVAPVVSETVSDNGVDCARGMIHLPHDVVAGVRDEEVAGGVQDHVCRGVEERRCGLAAVAAVARGPHPSDRGDHAGGEVDLTDAVIPRVGENQVPGGIEAEAQRISDRGCGRLAAVAAIARASVPAMMVTAPVALAS